MTITIKHKDTGQTLVVKNVEYIEAEDWTIYYRQEDGFSERDDNYRLVRVEYEN